MQIGNSWEAPLVIQIVDSPPFQAVSVLVLTCYVVLSLQSVMVVSGFSTLLAVAREEVYSELNTKENPSHLTNCPGESTVWRQGRDTLWSANVSIFCLSNWN